MATRQTTACFTLPINVLALNPSYYCQQCDQGGSILPGGPGPLTVTVGLSPDGKTLAAAAEGGNGTEVWDVATKHLIATVNGPGGSNNTEEPGPITFSPDGSLMAVVNTNNSGVTYLWRVSELEPAG
jgi:WD40 repeat protein